MTRFATISTVGNARNAPDRGSHGQRIIMGKVVDPQYYAALRKFMDRVSQDQSKKFADEGAADSDAVGVYNDTGRKFDKIKVSHIVNDIPKPPEVWFFVDRDTGEIYGPKSDQAPNLKRYFGTIYDARLWDWSSKNPTPHDAERAGVKAVRTYGDTTHYERV